MKRNIIRLSLLAIVVGVGWFAISQVRQSQDQASDQESSTTALGTEDLTGGDSQLGFTARKQQPVSLESGSASSYPQTPEPSRYGLASPPSSQLQAMPGTLSAGDEVALPIGTPPDTNDARLSDEAVPSAAVRNAPMESERTADGRYDSSAAVSPPASFDARLAQSVPLRAPSSDHNDSHGYDSHGYDTLRAQDTQLPTELPMARYPAPDASEGGFPSPQDATALLSRDTDPQDARESFAPSAFPQGPTYTADSAYAPDSAFAADSAYSSAEMIGSDEGSGRPGGEQLEGAQTPGLTLQKFAPAEIQVGKECTFTIKVRNTGQIAVRGVELHDEIPHGTRLVSTKPPAERGPRGELVWALGTLDIGEEATTELRLMPTAEGEIGSVATLQFEAQASVRTLSTRPELALRLNAPRQVMIGEDAKIEIEIGNPGSGAATNVMLIEDVPEGFLHPAGQSLEFEIGTLEPGETRQLELMMTAETAGRVINTLTARGDAGLDVQESIEVEIIAPELEVGLKGPTRRYLDRKASYTVSVNNPGTAAAKDIELVTRLPKGMKFLKANNSGLYDAATHSVYWSLAELPAKQRGTVELVALPVEAGELMLHVEGKAGQGLQHEASQAVLVEGVSAIMFEVVDLADPIEVGGETTYEVRVVNQGSKAATNVRIAALIPPGMTAVTAGGPTKHVIQNGRVLFEPLRRLAPKADATYRIQVQGVQPGDQRVLVKVRTDEVTKPVTKEESTRVYADE